MLKKLKEWDKKVSDKLDLNKRFPNYFNKTIFRTVAALTFVFAISLGFIYGLNPFYYECKDARGCLNPAFGMEGEKIAEYLPTDVAMFEYGYKVGEKSILLQYGDLIMYGLYIIAFGVNHLLYLRSK